MSRPVHNHTQLIFKYYLKRFSQNFHPHPQKSATKSFSRHSKRFVPGRPWTPLYFILFFKMFSKLSPPPSQKVLQNHFQVILSDLSLDAPVRPYAPVSKRVLLDEPGRRGVSPPPFNPRLTPISAYRQPFPPF